MKKLIFLFGALCGTIGLSAQTDSTDYVEPQKNLFDDWKAPEKAEIIVAFTPYLGATSALGDFAITSGETNPLGAVNGSAFNPVIGYNLTWFFHRNWGIEMAPYVRSFSVDETEYAQRVENDIEDGIFIQSFSDLNIMDFTVTSINLNLTHAFIIKRLRIEPSVGIGLNSIEKFEQPGYIVKRPNSHFFEEFQFSEMEYSNTQSYMGSLAFRYQMIRHIGVYFASRYLYMKPEATYTITSTNSDAPDPAERVETVSNTMSTLGFHFGVYLNY